MSDIEILRCMLKSLYDGERNELAERMLYRFGSLSGVLSATREELMTVKGITERTASFFTVLLPIVRQAILREDDGKIDSEKAVARFASAYFMNELSPSGACVCLDKHNEKICVKSMEHGIDMREIISCVCRTGTQKLLAIGYTPVGAAVERGITTDTAERIKRLTIPLKALDVEFIDYIEYTPFKLYSLRRALTGAETPITLDRASDEPYAPLRDFSAMLDWFVRGNN